MLVILLAGLTCVSIGRADYIIVVVNVGDAAKPPQAAGQFGVVGGPAGVGGAAGALGAPPGVGGAAGAIGNPPGVGGAAGAVGVGGAAGAIGNPPGVGGAAGAIGNPPGVGGAAGAIGNPPGVGGAAGAAGAIGNPPGVGGAAGAIGVMGAKGAMGGVGALGAPPMGSGQIGRPPMGGGDFTNNPGNFGNNVFGSDAPPEKETKIRAMVVIEMKQRGRIMGLEQKAAVEVLEHPWGKSSWLWAYDVDLDFLPKRDGKQLPAVYKRFADEKKALLMRGRSTQDLRNLAERALGWGLLKEFEEMMGELEKAEPTHAAVVAFKKIQPLLNGTIASAKKAAEWKTRRPFDSYRSKAGDYHVLLYRASESEVAVDSRLKNLTEHLRGFYYWHALQGKVLPLPKDKLVCVMVPGDGNDFLKQNNIFDAESIVADSFYSPRHNLIVFSSKRLDMPYKAVSRASEDLWKTFSRDEIIKGTMRLPRGTKLTEWVYAQTHAMLMKALDYDGERAAVSHIGTRQILVGAGLIPGNIGVPQWLQHGVGSFMETPYGSPWRSFGAPNWSYLLSFNELRKEQKLGPPDKLLRSLVTDEMFKSDGKEPSLRSRATAWAFTHFLMHYKMDKLHAYFKELQRLPRDLGVEGDVILDAFARAMDCYDTAGKKRDDAKLNQLAEEFLNKLEEVKLDSEVVTVYERIHKLKNEIALDQIHENARPRLPGGLPRLPGLGGFPNLPGFPLR